MKNEYLDMAEATHKELKYILNKLTFRSYSKDIDELIRAAIDYRIKLARQYYNTCTGLPIDAKEYDHQNSVLIELENAKELFGGEFRNEE